MDLKRSKRKLDSSGFLLPWAGGGGSSGGSGAGGEGGSNTNTGGGALKALYRCKYCGTDLSDTLRIRNAEHPSVDLCVDCFSVGAERWPHKRTHTYRVVEDLSSPLFDEKWGVDEELLLLEALEKFGPGNWSEIADHVGRKDKFECRTHYFDKYINSASGNYLPALVPFGTHRTHRTAAQAVGNEDQDKRNQPGVGAKWNDKEKETAKLLQQQQQQQKREEANKKTSENENGGGGVDVRTIEEEGGQGEVVPSSSVGVGKHDVPSYAEGNQQELTGYNVKRDDFEPEYDNDAEQPLAELEIRNEDSPEERAVKVEQLRLYFNRQKERYERRRFVKEKGLLNVRKQQIVEKKRTKEENEIHARMRVFARFQSMEEHQELVQGILKEQKLRQRISELKEYRRMGVVTLAEAELYEQDKRRRESEREKLKSADSSYLQQPAFKSSSAMRANRYFNRTTGNAEEDNNQVTSGSSRELQSLRIEANQGSDPLPNNIALVTKQMDPADLNHTPYLEALTAEEIDLCSSLRILPVQYLSIKSTMMVLSAKGKGLAKQDVREVSKVDVYKLNHIHDFLTAAKLISEP